MVDVFIYIKDIDKDKEQMQGKLQKVYKTLAFRRTKNV